MVKKCIKKALHIVKYAYAWGQTQRAFQRAFSEKAQKFADDRFLCRWEDVWPCLHDVTATTTFDAHYLYHTAWAIRVLAETRPAQHIDISSCLRFVSMASAIVPVDFYDYRPAEISLSGLSCGQADLTSLPFPDASVSSLSCMHVVEHIGLERYGDLFDPKGDLKAVAELNRVLSKGGQLLFVVPVGETARIQYNAHRIYTYDQILSYFSTLLLVDFALITDSDTFIENASPDMLVGQKYACGCFHFIDRG